MDYQAVIRTYGNTNLPDGTTERPLVTFALFAYNQEKYIRQAVEGAFSQTYSPLEIILSDDCSSDQTFEIIEALAREYRGPHLVKVRQGDRNVGVLAHVLHVAKIAYGQLFVVAAGDDISLPSRTAQIAQALLGTNYLALSSDDIIIDESGAERKWNEDRFDRYRSSHTANPAWIHGASAAYSTAFLKALPTPNDHIFYEDLVFCDLIQLFGARSARLNEKLIKYRFHSGNLSDRIRESPLFEDIERLSMQRWLRSSVAKKYCIDYVEKNFENLNISSGEFERLKLEYSFLSRISDWQNAKIIDRLQLLYFSLCTGNLRVALPRLFGKRVHFALRRFRPV